MDNLLYAIICSPFSLIASILNIFFLFCLRWPAVGINICQPLRFLLTTVLCNSTVHQLIIAMTIGLGFFTPPDWLLIVAKSLTYQTFCANFASNAWISIFYYMKIVPHKHPISLWIKRNIKVLTYSGYVLEQILLSSSIALGMVSYLLPPPQPPPAQNPSNSTSARLNGTNIAPETLSSFLFKQSTKVFLLYSAFPICALSISWGRTFIYLRGHMKRMEQSTSPFSQPQQQNQMRVTVMGIVQALLFIPSSVWSLIISIFYSSNVYKNLDGNKHITLTISSVSGLGNIVCLGISQAVFRVRVAAVLDKIWTKPEQTEQPKTGPDTSGHVGQS
ncbi:taste receptor type 2 member 60-like [Astyanax mexicanus]|uniref:Taste receptor type 2 n=2 Tax=Astyanax mexicanus TaxID=7994 RepID=A0A8B9RKK8_ASTMX|nr:taste receptor type 2 member 60-like [Astyanax mexicanus]